MKEQGGMLVEKVELELKDQAYLDNIGACYIFMLFKEEQKYSSHSSCDIIKIKSIKERLK